jgi:hypothetical protein
LQIKWYTWPHVIDECIGCGGQYGTLNEAGLLAIKPYAETYALIHGYKFYFGGRVHYKFNRQCMYEARLQSIYNLEEALIHSYTFPLVSRQHIEMRDLAMARIATILTNKIQIHAATEEFIRDCVKKIYQYKPPTYLSLTDKPLPKVDKWD